MRSQEGGRQRGIEGRGRGRVLSDARGIFQQCTVQKGNLVFISAL